MILNKEVLFKFVIICLISASFFLGYLLRVNEAGGGLEFYELSWPIIQSFKKDFLLTIKNYGYFLNINQYSKFSSGEDIRLSNYPYDKKWKIAIDGKPSQIYKANYSFMAVPIRKGNHTILLQYWPDTYLRLALCLSYLMVFFVLIFVFYYGINLEARRTSNVSE